MRDELSINVVTAYHDHITLPEAVPPPADNLLFADSDRLLTAIQLDVAIWSYNKYGKYRITEYCTPPCRKT